MNAPHRMTRRWLATSALGIFTLLATGCGVRSAKHAKVDQLFARWDRTESPGAAVVIVKDGAVVYQRGYGSANLEYQLPITPQTRFDVASVAKQFTGLAVAMLVQQGKLSLDDDIRKHLPDVPDFGKPITVAHLVHHTSGLRDWPETLRYSGIDMEAPITQDMILEMVRRQRELDFMPGEEHRYSNTGYNLLAATIAKVTGQSFRAWSDTALFQPLGMTRTQVCDQHAEVVTNCAVSYVAGEGGKYKRVSNLLSAQGSSSLLVSVEDMGKWLLNFETARVGGKAALELMHQPGKLNSGAKVDYAFGVGVRDNGGVTFISHSGSWAGFRSIVMRVPQKRFAVAILANAGNMDPGSLARKIVDIWTDLPAAPPTKEAPVAVKSDPAAWEPFLGTYRLGAGWLLTISREGEQLMAQATREQKFKMTPASDHRFYVEAYGAAVEFLRDASGGVTQLRYRGNNAPKLSVPESTPAYLAGFLGDYWSEELRVVGRIELHDGRLATQLRSGTWFHLLPTGTDRFDSDGGGMSIEFSRGPSTEVREMKISGGRVRNLRFTRAALPKSKPAEAVPVSTGN